MATLSGPKGGPLNSAQRILVVDDDAMVRRLSARVLLGSGYQVDTAENGVAGWEALQAQCYDLLLTDHNMPKLTGVELAQKLWATGMTLPAILVSGAPPTEALRQYPWLKFAAILAKPFSPQELLAQVNAVLRRPEETQRPAAGPVMFPEMDSCSSKPSSRWGLNQ